MNGEMSILLVEDNDLDVEILTRALKKLDAQVTMVRARDGAEALQILTAQSAVAPPPHPFVILLDINMPRMTGHEFLAALRESERISNARVFVFTTSAHRKDIELAYSKQVGGYIVKPSSSAELQILLTKLQDFLTICENPVVGAQAYG